MGEADTAAVDLDDARVDGLAQAGAVVLAEHGDARIGESGRDQERLLRRPRQGGQPLAYQTAQ